MSVRLTIDTTVGAAYVEIADAEVAETVHDESGVMVDLDSHGNAVGVEVLNPRLDLPLADLANRYSLPPEAIDFLRQVRTSASLGFGRYTQTTDGTSARRGIPAMA